MKKVIIIFITVMAFISTITFGASENKKLSKYEYLDSYLQNVVKDAHIPGMAIAVVNKDEALYSNTYGNCNSQSQQFIIGSLSKSFNIFK